MSSSVEDFEGCNFTPNVLLKLTFYQVRMNDNEKIKDSKKLQTNSNSWKFKTTGSITVDYFM